MKKLSQILTICGLIFSAPLFFTACKEEVTVPTEQTTTTVTNDNLTATNRAAVGLPPKPTGWTLKQSGNGVALYAKSGNRNGGIYADYVIAVDLSSGASVWSLSSWKNSTTLPASSSTAAFSPTMLKQDFSSWTTNNSKEFATINGEFFNLSASNFWGSEAQFAYPVKNNSSIVSGGYGNSDAFPKKKIGFSISSNPANSYATIADYSNTSNNYNLIYNNLVSSTVIVGLNPTADKDKNSYTGRTFVGVRDYNNDGKNETVYFYASNYATQQNADNVLKNEFLSSSTIMFDGSGSTQMKCKGTKYLKGDTRNIPHVFAIMGY